MYVFTGTRNDACPSSLQVLPQPSVPRKFGLFFDLALFGGVGFFGLAAPVYPLPRPLAQHDHAHFGVDGDASTEAGHRHQFLDSAQLDGIVVVDDIDGVRVFIALR